MTNEPHLLWIYTESPEDALDAATWLETTRELRTLGWRVTLVTPAIHGLSGERLVRDVPVVYVPRPNLYLFGQILFHGNLLRRLLGEWRSVDVVLLHQMSLLWMMPIKLLRWLRFGPGWGKQPQLVMDTRDLNPVEGGLKTKLRVWFYARMHQLANCCADGQTTITTQMAKLVNVPPAKLWGTWPSGVTPESFAPAVAMRRWPTTGEPLRLIYIGRLQQERNLLPLCQAVEKANRAGMAFHFRLVGSGPQEAELRIFADQSNGCVEVLPPVAHAEIPALLSSAHIGVTSLPTVDNLKYQASSPVKIFEYLAAGMPILSTANACHTDVIGQGAFAFWAEEPTVDGLSAALAKAWAAREQLAHHSDAAQCAAQDWSWHAAAKKLGEALLHFRRGR
ncbi:MAG TPA: glycosyltransferase [Caldilineaceae bacterium]|nr:glycosyltransferase [Caldilineaceae bacterium]